LEDYLNRVDGLPEQFGHTPFDHLAQKSLLVLLYWSGFRKSEIVGGKPHKYKVMVRDENGTKIRGKLQTVQTNEVVGILREDVFYSGNSLFVKAVSRKHGKRTQPQQYPITLPYVSLIKQQWERTPPRQKIWDISEWWAWKWLKMIDPQNFSSATFRLLSASLSVPLFFFTVVIPSLVNVCFSMCRIL